jgi:diguanylate cyclase (GGDEF)-like protein
MTRMWKGWLVLASVLTATYFLVPDSPESKLVLYNGTGLLAVVAVLYGVRRNKPSARTPWYFFAAGLGSFLTADICFYMLELVLGEAPFPSIADVFYLGMYPLVIIGLTKMLRSVSGGVRDTASFIDAAVVGIAMFGVLWVVFVDTVFFTAEHTTAALLTQLAYPVMDLAVLTVAARLVVKLHLKHPPIALIVLAIGSLAIADTGYGIYNAQGNFQTGLFIDAFWLGFYVLFGAAALHPAMSQDGTLVAEHSEGRLTPRQLVIMFVATLSVPVVDLIWGTMEDRVVTIISSALLALLILIRVFGLTKALAQGRDVMHHEATHDSLTGLANRVLFAQRIGQALTPDPAAATEQSGDNNIAVLFIDLDDFKTVNDSLGHHVGDQLLVTVADRLLQSVRPGDTVARLGGDEFAVLLANVVDRNDVVSVARRILEKLNESIDVGPREVHASCSIGIDIASDTDVDTLLRNADVAMYLSKSRGKGRFEFFESAMHEGAVERLDLKADLKRALAEDQFVLHYQPIFDLDTGKVSLTEALLRWRHPDRGMIGPDRFIPLAEESGLIVDIGAWVLREACKQTAKWQQLSGCENLGITVNLSMRQLHDSSLLHTLTDALRESGLNASCLVLEITESMLALDADRTTGILEQIKTTGVKLAIDDFGTGYSSLSYLRSFPVDSIKIDRSFISEINRSPTAPALIEAIVNLAQALGAATVAEGIELAEQATALRKLGCDRGQGYYYCRPMAAPALGTLLGEHSQGEVELLAAWRRSAEKAQERSYDIEVRRGLSEVMSVGAEIDRLCKELHVPLMASWPWLRTWAEACTDWSPLMVGVRRADSGQLVGCALLATRDRAQGTAVVAMGHGSSLHSTLHAADEGASHALADAVTDTLNGLSGAWSLDLEQLNSLDPTALQLVESLDQAQLLPELRVPRVIFGGGNTMDTVLSKNMRKQLRRSRNKISAEGLTLSIAFDRGHAISSELIDEVEAVHVSRDRAARRASDLDRPAEREFWRRIVEGGRWEWEVEIASLRLDGQLAAYVVALLDGDVYRVYDGRMNTAFEDYSPGRLVESAALERALIDPRFRLLDWMSGVAAEKLLVSNGAEARARLVATSGSRFVSAKRTPLSDLVPSV